MNKKRSEMEVIDSLLSDIRKFLEKVIRYHHKVKAGDYRNHFREDLLISIQYRTILQKLEEDMDSWTIKTLYEDRIERTAILYLASDIYFGRTSIDDLFLNPAIQACISKVIERLIVEFRDRGSQSCLLDIHQQSFFYFKDLSVRFFKVNDGKDDDIYLKYIFYLEEFMFKKLKHWFLTEVGYKYNKGWKERDERPYIPRTYPLSEEIITKKSIDTVFEKNSIADCYNSPLAEYAFDDLIKISHKHNPVQAKCLELYYGQQLKAIEISDLLRIPLNTVKSHIRRGLDRIRRGA